VTDERSELFIRLLGEHEKALARYVFAMVPQAIDAEDILQESKLVMWRHFEQFELDSNFKAWARKIIFNRILAFRKKMGKYTDRYVFSDDFYQALDERYEKVALPAEKISKLQSCIAHLQDTHQAVLKNRYSEDMSIEEIASHSGRTVV
jgi:RNA polymerase sigma-70 factor, ECF subfamily